MTNNSEYFSRNRKQRSICSNLAIEQCLARRVLCVCNVILRHPLFEQIPRCETHKLSAIADIIKLDKGGKLFFKGSEIKHIYFVLKGTLKLFTIDDDSSKIFIDQIAYEGDGIGLESLFADIEIFNSNAEALESSTVLMLDRAKLKKIICNNPSIQKNLLEFLSWRLIEITERLQDQVLLEVADRLQKFTAQHCELRDTKLSKSDIAYLLGTIPATLSRAMKR